MKTLSSFIHLMKPFFNSTSSKLACLLHCFHSLSSSIFRALIFRVQPFWIQLHYFLIFSLLGFLALKVSKPRTAFLIRPSDFDLFFTSVSATTVSSMSTLEMEVFSNTQLFLLAILMLVGGEVFISMVGLQFLRSKLTQMDKIENRVNIHIVESDSTSSRSFGHDQIELGLVNFHELETEKPKTNIGNNHLKKKSLKCLSYVVLFYLLVVHIFGSILIFMYTSLVSSAREVLKSKGLNILTFSIFTTISTFANCGFAPTNENMLVFRENSGLLLLLIPQTLLGNTLYPVFLRFLLWVLERITKREEFGYILKNSRELGYSHMVSSVHCWCLVGTVFGFILVQFVVFCSLEWRSEAMDGLNWYQRLVGSLFQVVNIRHAGESVFDVSLISQAMVVLVIIMMYLPPYTTFLPIEDNEKVSRNDKKRRRERKNFVEYLLFSQLSYLAIFIIIICIIERQNMKEDPLNFNVLSITTEVFSAYGNVGLSTGYSCRRQLKPDGHCKDGWYGFVGRWSNMGKLVLILVMFFGRLKKFNMDGGQAWKLS